MTLFVSSVCQVITRLWIRADAVPPVVTTVEEIFALCANQDIISTMKFATLVETSASRREMVPLAVTRLPESAITAVWMAGMV